VNLLRIDSSEVRIKVELDDERDCGVECSNVKCFEECKTNLECDDGIDETIDKCISGECRNNILEKIEIEAEEPQVEETEEVIEERENGDINTVTMVLISIVVLLGLILLLRKNKRKDL